MKKIGIVCLVAITAVCWLWPDQSFSESERRKLQQCPNFSIANVLSGRYMSEFEKYVVDQFPFRNQLLAGNQAASMTTDENGLYEAEGHLSRMEYPLDKKSVETLLEKFQQIQTEYFAENQVYLSVIPDKNYYLAEENGYLEMDYETLFEMANAVEGMEFISLEAELSLNDFYSTDTHWKQEEIVDIADKFAGKMGITLPKTYEVKTMEKPFRGVYAGQYGIKQLSDTMQYVTNDVIEEMCVYDWEHDQEIKVYDVDKMNGSDGYELFLGGSLSLVTIENPKGMAGRELVLFRDSFGSSLAPLLAQGYEKVTLVDIRYIPFERVCDMIEIENADVLFLYSASVLNHAETFQ